MVESQQGRARAALTTIGESWLTIERAAYGAIVIVALGIRCSGLGAMMLGPEEAAQALAAWSASTGQAANLAGLSPLLHTVQRLLFALFGPTDAAARWLPALLGGLAPLFFWPLRRYLTRGGALAAALLWALSPLAVFAGRLGTPEGLAPPLFLALLGWLTIAARPSGQSSRNASAIGIGVTTGMLLLSGADAYSALLGGFVMLAVWRPNAEVWQRLRPLLRKTLYALAGTLVLVGTFFFDAPAGLAASAGLLTQWLHGLAPGSDTYGTWEILRQLLLGEPLLLGFGVAAVIGALRTRSRWGKGVALATGVWLAIALIGRGRAPADLGLVTLGLAILAGPAVARALRGFWLLRQQSDAWLLIGISSALLMAAALSLAGISSSSTDWLGVYSVLGGIALALSIAIWIVYGFFGSWRTVAQAAPMIPLAIGLLWGVGQLTSLSYDRDPWRNPGVSATRVAPGLRLLQQEVVLSGALVVGGHDETELDLVLPAPATNSLSPTLRWALRNARSLRVTSSLGQVPAPIVITDVAHQPALADRYVGAEYLVLDQTRPGPFNDARTTLRWILFRESKVIPDGQRVILWVDRSQQ